MSTIEKEYFSDIEKKVIEKMQNAIYVPFADIDIDEHNGLFELSLSSINTGVHLYLKDLDDEDIEAIKSLQEETKNCDCKIILEHIFVTHSDDDWERTGNEIEHHAW